MGPGARVLLRALRAPTTPERVAYRQGDILGSKYLLLREVGHGAMGTVWVASNVTLNLEVAIKFVPPQRGENDLRDRLLEEARATASLRHPAIVQVFDFGEPEGYMVMELLEGESLRTVINRDGIRSAARAVQILLPVASGMAAAHARGIVHRDLKPDNIVLVRDGSGRLQPKVIDFGLAEEIWRCRTDGIEFPTAGTPGYMAPEQVLGDAVDARTDVWGLCAVLYELLSGDAPFPYGLAPRVVTAVVTQEMRSLAGHPLVDDALWAILERGLQKKPADRFASMRELGVELARWLIDQSELEDISGVSVSTWWERPIRLPMTPATDNLPTLDETGARGRRARERTTKRPTGRQTDPVPLVRRRASGSGPFTNPAIYPVPGAVPSRPILTAPPSAKPRKRGSRAFAALAALGLCVLAAGGLVQCTGGPSFIPVPSKIATWSTTFTPP